MVPTRPAPDGPDTVFPMALLKGSLVISNQCIQLVSSWNDEHFTLMWPYGTRYCQDDAHLEIPDSGRLQRIALHSELRVGGGEIPGSHAKKLADLGDCPGPYWLVSVARTNNTPDGQ